MRWMNSLPMRPASPSFCSKHPFLGCVELKGRNQGHQSVGDQWWKDREDRKEERRMEDKEGGENEEAGEGRGRKHAGIWDRSLFNLFERTQPQKFM